MVLKKEIDFNELSVDSYGMDALGNHQANEDAVSQPVEARGKASDAAAAPEPPESPETALREPGRPKGYAKTGGRRKGVKNRRTKEIEEALRPLVPAAKKKLKALMGSEDDKVAYSACMGVFSYVFGKPIDRQQIGGMPDSEPVKVDWSDMKIARHLALRLFAATNKADKAPRHPRITNAPPGGKITTGAAPASKPLNESNAAPADGADKAQDAQTPDGGGNADTEPTESQRPKPGGAAFLSYDVRIVNGGPMREGLPDIFTVRDAAGTVLRHAGGDYESAVKWARERFGLADAKLSIGPANRPEPRWAHPDQRDRAPWFPAR